MQVWEKIKELEGKDSFDSAEDVSGWMYANRVIPCDMEAEFNILGNKTMNQLCGKHKLDCLPCLEEYLKTEIERMV